MKEWTIHKEKIKAEKLEKRVAQLEAALKKIAALDVDEYRRKNPTAKNGDEYAALFSACQGIAISAIGY